MSESKEFQKELADFAPAPVVEGSLPGMATFAMEYSFLEAFVRGTRL